MKIILAGFYFLRLKVQASRSIVWHLKEGESLALKKMDSRHGLSPEAALDHRITFCVTLLHLDESLSQGNLTTKLLTK